MKSKSIIFGICAVIVTIAICIVGIITKNIESIVAGAVTCFTSVGNIISAKNNTKTQNNSNTENK